MPRRPESHTDPASFLPLPGLPYAILVVLVEEPRHGWAIIRRIEELQGGREVPSTGSLYLALARLAERGLIEQVAHEGDDRRRVYRATALGRRVTKMESLRLASLVGIVKRSVGRLEGA